MGSPLEPQFAAMFLAERLGLALLLGVFLRLAFEDVYKRGEVGAWLYAYVRATLHGAVRASDPT